MYRTLLRRVYADRKIADDRIRTSGLDWTLVYPTALTDSPAEGGHRVGERLAMRGSPRISRADVAAFMLRAARGSERSGRDAVITG
ncbi:NAD(P)H-binding protein [Streptomyces flaveolus]|uniref:NAD(P)H-binding protein n=1 Tax=Streptomyces flaveolus TaxID=67297 RepID=UPI003415E3ED